MALGVLAKYDYVGSFLRPQAIKEARTKFSAGQISEADLHAVEDTCIKKIGGRAKGCRLSSCDRWGIPPGILAFRLYVGPQRGRRN